MPNFYRSCLLMLAIADAVFAQQVPTDHKQVEWPIPARSAAGTPASWNFGQVPGVAITKAGQVLVLHRGAQPVIEFDAGGKFIRAWGEGMFSEGKVMQVGPANRAPGASNYSAVYGPAGCHNCGVHSIRVDPQGNIWIVDATAHMVYKMDGNGRILMRLGQRGVSGIDQKTFNLPTDVAFAANGDLYVSDGYANPRVVKFSRDGKYLAEWGKRGHGPGEFQLPHNLVVDAQGRVYVTDRDNQRVEVFDADGKFLKQWPTGAGVSTLFMTKDRKIWAGGVLRDLDGNALAKLPETGGHGTAVSESGEVYLAQLTGVVQKFVKK
jgi:DNA-binding beta-propeller fold protein YncE